jgi:carbohydrate diacid regulator
MTMTGVVSSQLILPQLVCAIVESVLDKTSYGLPSEPVDYSTLKKQLFKALLQGQISSEAEAIQQAKELGIQLNPPRAVILVSAVNYLTNDLLPQLEQQRSQALIDSIVGYFHLPDDTICADLGGGKICILKASDTKNLDPWVEGEERRSDSAWANPSWANLTALKRATAGLRLKLQQETGCSIQIGIGRYHPGIQGLARSYEDAHAALSLGSRLQKADSVYCLAELGVAAFVGVADEMTKVELAKYLLGPLDYEPDLLVTINTFFAENCCSSATAKQLYIHRNTLNYRLEKITSLIGLDPRRFDDAIQIRISLLLRSLF